MFSIEELKINATVTPLDDLNDVHQIDTAATGDVRVGFLVATPV